VCAGDEVMITCGYNFSIQIPPVWIIGGLAYSGSNIENSTIFELPEVTDTMDAALILYSADESFNQTSFQCEFGFQTPVQSTTGVLTVMGKGTIHELFSICCNSCNVHTQMQTLPETWQLCQCNCIGIS